MSEPIQTISQGNYILQGTVATSTGIVGDGTTQNPLRVDETVLYEGTTTSQVPQSSIALSEPATNFEKLDILYFDRYGNISDSKTVNTANMTFENGNTSRVRLQAPFMYDATSPMYMRISQYKFSNTTTMTFEANGQIQVTTTGIQSTYSTTPNNQGCFIYKVVGINRIGNS